MKQSSCFLQFTNHIPLAVLSQFFKPVQRVQSYLSVFTSDDFGNFQYFSTLIPDSSKMHYNIYSGSDLVPNRRQWKVHSHKYHILQPGQHVCRTVGMTCGHASVMPGIQALYMDSLCSHHAEIQYLYLIYTVYNVIILPFHSCKKKREPFTALFHIDFLIHLSYLTVWQPMSLNFFQKMGQSLVLHQMPSQLLSFAHILLQIPMQIHNSKHLSE